MSTRPYIEATNAFEQAKITANSYMCSAAHAIDTNFGEGYAVEHPELIAAYMHAAAHDFRTVCLSDALFGIKDSLAEIASSLDRD